MTNLEATTSDKDASGSSGQGAAEAHPKTDAPTAASPRQAKKTTSAASKTAAKSTNKSTAKSTTKSTTKSSTKKAAAKKTAKSADAAKPPEARSAAEIQADIDAAQVRLAAHVDELSDRLNPQHLAEEAVTGVKRVFLNEDGSPKGKPIAIAAGSLTALLVLRKIFHRK